MPNGDTRAYEFSKQWDSVNLKPKFKIVQISAVAYASALVGSLVFGLGNDEKVYIWSKSKGKWEFYKEKNETN